MKAADFGLSDRLLVKSRKSTISMGLSARLSSAQFAFLSLSGTAGRTPHPEGLLRGNFHNGIVVACSAPSCSIVTRVRKHYQNLRQVRWSLLAQVSACSGAG